MTATVSNDDIPLLAEEEEEKEIGERCSEPVGSRSERLPSLRSSEGPACPCVARGGRERESV